MVDSVAEQSFSASKHPPSYLSIVLADPQVFPMD